MKRSLQILSGAAQTREIPLEIGKYSIGRGVEATIQIASSQISRRHAEIVVTQDNVTILDCGSANGTAVNGKFLTTAYLRNNDQIMIGDVVLAYYCQEAIREQESIPPPSSKVYVAATKIITDRLRPRALWPLFSCVFGLTFLSFSLVAGLSFRSLLKNQLTQEVMQRGAALVRYMAEKNREHLRMNNELLIDVESVQKEKGVHDALILDSKGRILAPFSRLNRMDHDPFTAEALAHNSDQPIPPSPLSANGTHTLVAPVRVFDHQSGQYNIVGAARLVFSPTDAIGPLHDANRLIYLMIAAALGLSLFLGWLSSRALAAPMTRLAEKIHQWRSGQVFQKETPPYRDWAPLFDAVDQALDEAGQ